MEERKYGVRAALTAFTLTLLILAAVLCAVHADCVMYKALHGRTVFKKDVAPPISTTWLPPSANVLKEILQAERKAVAAVLDVIQK